MRKKGFTPFQILKDSLISICHIRRKDSLIICDDSKKFGTGFTLTEIIISVLLVTLISAGVFGAFVGSQYFFNRSRHRLQAINFAREAIDRMRSQSDCEYNDPNMGVGTTNPESNLGAIIGGDFTDLNAELTYDVDDPEPGAPEPDGYKEVTVTVTWEEESAE